MHATEANSKSPPIPDTAFDAVGDGKVVRLIKRFLDGKELSFDVGEVHLRLAQGLPGSKEWSVDELLARLDEWAALVALAVRNARRHFEQSPEEYENSWPYFQVLVQATVLGRNLGVHYRPDLMTDPVDWSDCRSKLLPGPMTGYGGTCSSMPVLYVAIGRRLGWPVWLVGAKQHLFVRWQDDNETRNFEVTGQGLATYSDEYYRTWPLPIEQHEIDRGWYLHNKSPRNELAWFLVERAACLADNMQWAASLKVYLLANAISPGNPNLNGFHAIASVLFLIANGLARYRLNRDMKLIEVIDRNGSRQPEAWESWAAPLAWAEQDRIFKNRRRQRQDPSAVDAVIATSYCDAGW